MGLFRGRRRAVALLFTATAAVFSLVAARASTGVAQETFQSRGAIAFRRAHPSVVYLESSNGHDVAGCTGSIVSSSSAGSTVMTAAHCVTGMNRYAVYLHEDVAHAYPASLLKMGSTTGTDVAFLQIGVGNQPVLPVGAQAEVGAKVVIIGYPRAALADFQQRHVLVARQDETAIASVVPRANGLPQIIEYQHDTTDHGDSGAPVIELECGCIVGVVHGAYNERVGLTDYAMGPEEVVSMARQSSPQVALKLIGAFPQNDPPPPAAPLAKLPPRSGGLPLASLSTVAGPKKAQWSGWGSAITLREIGAVSDQVRCVRISDEYLWQVQAVNAGARTVAFQYRLTNADGVALDGPMKHALDNTGAYLFIPQQLPVPCNSTVYQQVTNVEYSGDPKTPRRESLLPTHGGPLLLWSAWKPWKSSNQLPGVQIAFRCVDLGDNWFGWQMAFKNESGSAYAFDFDIEPSGAPAKYRLRYQLPASKAVYYSGVVPTSSGGSCSQNEVNMYARR